MMKKILAALILVSALAFAGCPSLNQPIAATGNPVGSKVGQAEGKIILGLFGDVDAGIQAAAESAGITQISTVDFKVKALLGNVMMGGLVTTYTTTVTGE